MQGGGGPFGRYLEHGEEAVDLGPLPSIRTSRHLTVETLPCDAEPESDGEDEGDSEDGYGHYDGCDVEVGAVTKECSTGKSELAADPNDPRINVWSLGNRALPLSCLAIGFAMTFMTTPLTWYAIRELNVGPTKMSVLGTLVALPTSLKIFFGLLTDCVPIRGLRRKPYIILGWLLFVAANITLAVEGTPSITHLAFFSFLMVFGYILAEVACEAVIVERSVYEPEDKAGRMQGTGYMCRSMGNIMGAVCGLVVYNKAEWGWGLTISQIFFINGLLPVVVVLPWVWYLSDPLHFDSCRSIIKQFRDLWHMAKRRTVWRPMLFVAFYNMLQVPNSAWGNFLVIGLEFTPWRLGILSIVTTFFSWMGITAYQIFFTKCSWRTIYVTTTLVGAFFSMVQLLLIFRINVKWGISDLMFSLGDDAIAAFNAAIQFLPTVIMYTRICPTGAEGTSYAMLVTFFNVALEVGSNIGTLMTRIWDVSNETIWEEKYDGVWKLTVLTSLIQIAGLALVWLLPRNVEEQTALQKNERRSVFGGLFFVGFFVGALLWTIIQAAVILNGDGDA